MAIDFGNLQWLTVHTSGSKNANRALDIVAEAMGIVFDQDPRGALAWAETREVWSGSCLACPDAGCRMIGVTWELVDRTQPLSTAAKLGALGRALRDLLGACAKPGSHSFDDVVSLLVQHATSDISEPGGDA